MSDHERFEKLLAQMGEHLSHMRGDIGEMKIAMTELPFIKTRLEGIEAKQVEANHATAKLKDYNLIQGPKIDATYLDLTNRNNELKANYKKWIERFVWIAISVGLFIMARMGLIHPDLLTNIF